MKDLNDYKISDSEIAGKKIEGRPNPLVSETAAENQAKFDALPKAIAEKMNAGFGAAAENFNSVSNLISETDSGQSAALAAHAADEKHHVPNHEGSAECKILGLKADGTAPEWKDYSKMVEERDKVISDAREEFSETVAAADAAFEADRTAFSAEMNEIKSETEQAKSDAFDAANAAVSSVTAIAKESEKKVKETADAVSRLAEETLIPAPNYEEDNEKCLKAGYEETEVSLTAVSLSDHMRSADVAGVLGEVQSGDAFFALDTTAAPGNMYAAEEYTVPEAAVLLYGGTYPNFSRIGTGTGVTIGSEYTSAELSAYSDVCISGNGRFVVHNAVLNTGHAVSEVTYIAVRLYPALPGADVNSYVPNTYSADNDESGMFFKGDVREGSFALTDGTSVTVGNAFLWYAYDASLDADELPCTVTRIVSPGTIESGTVNVLKRARQMGWFDAKGYTDKFAVFPFTVNSSERVYLYDDDGLIQSAETLDITILTAQDKPVDFYISTADTFSVPADTEKLHIDFKKGEAYKKSRTDLKLTRYTDLDWLAGSETFKNYHGYSVYMNLQDESAVKVLYSYTAVVSVRYAVSQKVDKIDGKGLSSNDFTNLLKEKLENNYVIGSVKKSEFDNAKDSGIYKVIDDNQIDSGYLLVIHYNNLSTAQYYFPGAESSGVVIKQRAYVNGDWFDWESVSDMIKDSQSKIKTYTDKKLGENLTAAKTYTDSKDAENLSAAKTYTDTKDAENLSAAKTYADGKGAETLESAKSYVDARSKSLEERSKRYTNNRIGGVGSKEVEQAVSDDYVETITVQEDTPLVSFTVTDKSAPHSLTTAVYTITFSDNSTESEHFALNVTDYTVEIESQKKAVSVSIENIDSSVVITKYVYSAPLTAKEYTDTKAAAAEENAKTYGNQTFAGALKGEKLGGIVRLDDVSALDRRLDTVVSSKNIIPFPYADGMSKTVNGVTFTVSDDGSITVNGTATSDAMITIANNLYLEKGSYMLSGMPQIELSGKNNGGVLFLFEKSNEKVHLDYSAGAIVNIEQSGYVSANIKIYAGASVENVVVKPMLECGTSSTAYTKHVSDLSGVSVKKYGKNFFDCYGISANTIEKPGAYCSLSNKYNTTIDKKALSSASDVLTVTQSAHPNETQKFSYTNGYFCIGLSNLLEGQAYTLSFDFTATDDPFSMMSDFTNNSIYVLINGSTMAYWKKVSGNRYSVSFTYTKRTDYPLRRYIEFRLYGMSGTFSAFQLETLSTASAYVPWSAPTTYTVGADGAVQNLSANEGTTTLATDNEGTVLKTKYSRDLNAAFTEIQNAIIALGGSF